MATKRKRRATKPKAKGRTTNIVVAKTRHHGKRRTTRRAVRGTSVGSTAVGKTHHRRKRRKSTSVMGFTSAGLKLKDGLMMAMGVGAGIFLNHKVLRPLEVHLIEKQPGLAKFMGVLQTGLGFVISVKGKHPWMKAAGITIMTGGVNSIIRTTGIEKHIPGISGAGDDWTTVKIPISGAGEFKSMVAGLLQNNQPPKWGMVAASGHSYNAADTYSNSPMPNRVHTEFKSQVAGEELEDYTMMAKG